MGCVFINFHSLCSRVEIFIFPSESPAGLFLLEVECTTVAGLTLALLPAAGQGVGVKTMQGSHLTEKGLYL